MLKSEKLGGQSHYCCVGLRIEYLSLNVMSDLYMYIEVKSGLWRIEKKAEIFRHEVGRIGKH